MSSDPAKQPNGNVDPNREGLDKEAPLWNWIGRPQPPEAGAKAPGERLASADLLARAEAEWNARPSRGVVVPTGSERTEKRSRGRIALIACGVVIGLLVALRLMAPVLFPSEYEVLSESPKIIVPEIGGVKIGDSLADAKPHMKFLTGDENKTTGSGYKTVPIDGGEIWIEYWFLDSKVVDIELRFPGESFDILVDLLSEKFGERPYMVRREKNGAVTKYWKIDGGDFLLTRPRFVIDKPNTAHGFSISNHPSSWTVRFRQSGERDEQTKEAIKKQL